MKNYKGVIRTNKVGSDCHFEFEIDDDASEEEVEEIAREVAFEYIDFYYEQVG